MDLSPAEEVLAARLRAGLSQRELAERSGLRQPNIAAYEAGRRVPSTESLRKVLDAARLRPSQALARHRERVLDLVRDHGGSEVRVFGSVAHGTDTVDSDLDLVVRFERGTGLLRLAALVGELEELLGVEVDIIEDTATGPTVSAALSHAVAV